MMSAAEREEIVARLDALARSDTAAGRQAAGLRDRLGAPVRVVLLGLPGGGMPALAAALSGCPDLPGGADPERRAALSFELVDAPATEARITAADGSVRSVAGWPAPSDLADAVFVRLARPLPPLAGISLLVLAADPEPEEQRAAIDWARRRSDIAIWCSRGFGTDDRTIWDAVPDALRDHAFLALTDPAASPVPAPGDFRGVHRLRLGDPADGGVPALAAAVTAHAEAGQRADADAALLLLAGQGVRGSGHGPQVPGGPAGAPRPPSQAVAPDASAAGPQSPETKPTGRPDLRAPAPQPIDPDRLAAPLPDPRSPVTAPPSPSPAHAAPAHEPPAPRSRDAATASPVTSDAAASAPVTRGRTRSRPVLCTGFAHLRDIGEELLHEVRSGRVDEAAIVARCQATLAHLSDLLSFHEEDDDLTQLSDTIFEAEQVIVLLGSERAPDSALDAVSLLIQVRQDFETAIAA